MPRMSDERSITFAPGSRQSGIGRTGLLLRNQPKLKLLQSPFTSPMLGTRVPGLLQHLLWLRVRLKCNSYEPAFYASADGRSARARTMCSHSMQLARLALLREYAAAASEDRPACQCVTATDKTQSAAAHRPRRLSSFPLNAYAGPGLGRGRAVIGRVSRQCKNRNISLHQSSPAASRIFIRHRHPFRRRWHYRSRYLFRKLRPIVLRLIQQTKSRGDPGFLCGRRVDGVLLCPQPIRSWARNGGSLPVCFILKDSLK